MSWEAFAQRILRLQARILGVEVQDSLGNVVEGSLGSDDRREDVQNVDDWVGLVRDGANIEEEVGAVAAHIDAPERAVAVAESVPQDVEC